ncbi:MAG: VWA domain-containing protein [Bdellovibrionota bacterium]
MNSIQIKFLILSAGFFILQSCDVKSPQRQDTPETFGKVTTEESQSGSLPDPQVNILFVVDNSGSMKGYQAKLAENIELFANEFFDDARIDYRIGVVPVYDSKYLNDTKVYGTSGVRKMNALGELVPLVGLNSADKQLYITRNTPNPKEVLKKTVLIGVQWGPEAEESYSPVLAITDPERNHNVNQDFYLPDAHLAVIFLTDADDVTPGLSAEDFYQRLVKLKGGDRSKVLIAAALPELSNNSANCAKDGKGPVQSFPSLLDVSNAIFADLCSDNFGKTLASFGNLLTRRVATQKFSIGYTPDIDSLVVTYGPKDQPEDQRQHLQREKNEYVFIPDSNEIILNPYLKLQRIENAKIWITAKPASLGNFKTGRLQTL